MHKLSRLFLVPLLGLAVLACDDDPPPPPPPDYNITGEQPSEIKTLAGGGGMYFRRVSTRRAGTVPGTTQDIPVPPNVTLGVGPLGGGITAAYLGAAAGRPEFDARLQINVPAATAVGSYPIAVTGAAPPVAPKTATPYTVRVYGPDDGGAYIEVTPSEVVLTPGGPGVVVMATVTRIPPYAGPVTVTYPGAGTALPPGVRVTGQTSYTFNVGPAARMVMRQFIIIANGEAAAGHTFPQAEVRTGAAGPGAKTDVAPHVVSVR